MPADEVEVYVTLDGRGRAAIVRRRDGRFCLYRHWRDAGSWLEDPNVVFLRYDDADPEQVARPLVGIYGTVIDARRELRGLPGFRDAIRVENTAQCSPVSPSAV